MTDKHLITGEAFKVVEITVKEADAALSELTAAMEKYDLAKDKLWEKVAEVTGDPSTHPDSDQEWVFTGIAQEAGVFIVKKHSENSKHLGLAKFFEGLTS